MRTKLLTTALASCFAIALLLGDLSGKWQGNLQLPDGQNVQVTYTINIEGDKVTGVAETFGHSLTIENGKVSGNDFTFSITNNNNIIIPHTGKFYPEGDSVSMNMDYGGAKFHTILRRVK